MIEIVDADQVAIRETIEELEEVLEMLKTA